MCPCLCGQWLPLALSPLRAVPARRSEAPDSSGALASTWDPCSSRESRCHRQEGRSGRSASGRAAGGRGLARGVTSVAGAGAGPCCPWSGEWQGVLHLLQPHVAPAWQPVLWAQGALVGGGQGTGHGTLSRQSPEWSPEHPQGPFHRGSQELLGGVPSCPGWRRAGVAEGRGSGWETARLLEPLGRLRGPACSRGTVGGWGLLFLLCGLSAQPWGPLFSPWATQGSRARALP